MSSSTTEFQKIWIDQCAATEDIRDHLGPQDALMWADPERMLVGRSHSGMIAVAI
jgi:hypothetical protein